jgi:hypothetical protein
MHRDEEKPWCTSLAIEYKKVGLVPYMEVYMLINTSESISTLESLERTAEVFTSLLKYHPPDLNFFYGVLECAIEVCLVETILG